MGRHQKKGLDYFPLDVHMDNSVALLEVDHGLEGFAILIKLYQKIYADGYYIHVSANSSCSFNVFTVISSPISFFLLF